MLIYLGDYLTGTYLVVANLLGRVTITHMMPGWAFPSPGQALQPPELLQEDRGLGLVVGVSHLDAEQTKMGFSDL